MKKAYSPKDITRKKYQVIDWGEEWSAPFGKPEMTDTWFISGPSASGKSSFVMQLSKELCHYGPVLYGSYEEGVSKTYQDRLLRHGMDEVQGRFKTFVDDTLHQLHDRLKSPGYKKVKFVVIDSFQYTGWTYGEAKSLVEAFPNKSFIFISQEYKGEPMGKAAVRLRYMAGVKVKVSNYKAYCIGRYTGEPGTFYTIWEEGIMMTSNNV